MSKILTGIAVVASGIALAISMTASAGTTQVPEHSERQHSVDKRSQVLQLNIDLSRPESDRFPLMLPQPTKIDNPRKYAIG
jgi:hypothetical protein